ncbi:hypothetical protein BCR42DRAFT_428478 [Absidia repens]|uniref:F-box domain-containing protein n=1 Tax=Absidia repens TaxID=90262 RepID=A0A1X2HYC4_9FUNG|nr:hypothetical protein BCR42DRAFT_428478 [Absidia repens]
MNHLPPEIISSILQHISEQSDLLTCTLVNRCIYEATLPFLWRFFAQGKQIGGDKEEERTMVSTFLDCLMQQPSHPIVKHVQELELYSRWTDNQLMRLISLIGPQVKNVYIANGQAISDMSLQPLARAWPQLTDLYLYSASATQASMVALARHCPRLRVLSLSCCPDLSPDTFAPFVHAGNAGVGVGVENVTLYTNGGPEPWNDQTVLDLAQLPLRSFSFSGHGSSSDIMHSSILTSVWPQLTHLELECIGAVGDDSRLIPFIKAHPQLTEVTLHETLMTDATLDAMGMYLRDVTYLGLAGNRHITVSGVRRLVRHHRHWYHLAWVDLYNCKLKYDAFPEACRVGDPNDALNNCVHHLNQDAIDTIRQMEYPEL